jgi:hypothetical protein
MAIRRALVLLLMMGAALGSASLPAETRSETDWSAVIEQVKPSVVWGCNQKFGGQLSDSLSLQ